MSRNRLDRRSPRRSKHDFLAKLERLFDTVKFSLRPDSMISFHIQHLQGCGLFKAANCDCDAIVKLRIENKGIEIKPD